MADAHVLARIPAYRLGLLEPPSALEVREHLRGCAPCMNAFEPFTEISAEEETRFGHVPIALLVRWDLVASLLSHDERICLEAHLASCERCSESRAFAREIRALADVRPAPARRPWLGFGTAAMAAVLAVAVVFALRDRPAPQTSIPAPVATPAPSTVAAPLRAPIVTLGGVVRNGGPLVERVPRGATLLPIRVPPLLGVGPDARIHIRVDGPGGAEFGKTEVAHRRLFGPDAAPALEATAPEGPLPEGHYKVTVEGGGESVTYDFDLKNL